jgi:hypothetical protein
MVYKIGLLGFFILIAINLHAFQHSKSVMKKVHTEIVASFDVEQFELNELIISDVVNAKLQHKISPNNLFKIVHNQMFLGYAYINKAPSKTDTFDYLLLLDTDLIIKKAKVLIYREDYGGEIGSRRWLKQFIGKSPKDQLKYTQHIMAISGATISAFSMTNAIALFLQDAIILQQHKVI